MLSKHHSFCRNIFLSKHQLVVTLFYRETDPSLRILSLPQNNMPSVLFQCSGCHTLARTCIRTHVPAPVRTHQHARHPHTHTSKCMFLHACTFMYTRKHTYMSHARTESQSQCMQSTPPTSLSRVHLNEGCLRSTPVDEQGASTSTTSKPPCKRFQTFKLKKNPYVLQFPRPAAQNNPPKTIPTQMCTNKCDIIQDHESAYRLGDVVVQHCLVA